MLVAVTALKSAGHEVVPFRPTGLKTVRDTMFRFSGADGGRFIRGVLKDGPVQMDNIGMFYRLVTWPNWLRKIVALLVAYKVSEGMKVTK